MQWVECARKVTGGCRPFLTYARAIAFTTQWARLCYVTGWGSARRLISPPDALSSVHIRVYSCTRCSLEKAFLRSISSLKNDCIARHKTLMWSLRDTTAESLPT